MRLIVITAPGPVADEAETFNALFAEGLELLHIRKPEMTRSDIGQLIEMIQPNFRGRIALHSHHDLVAELGVGGSHYPAHCRDLAPTGHGRKSTSCHSEAEVRDVASQYDYLFLSPVFDSISKQGYRSRYSQKRLIELTNNHSNLVALGGVDEQTLPQLLGHKWAGAATLGAVWQQPTVKMRLQAFHELQTIIGNT